MRINPIHLIVFSVFYCLIQEASAKTQECPENSKYYVFSWPLTEGCDDRPRGGTSKGVDVELLDQPHPGWLLINDSELSKFEKDRAAILAMAGGYRVDFDFLETVGFEPDFVRDKPYHSWGTEYVYVVEDQPNFISLQHLMVMYFEQEDGSVSEPFVMKHWRQDWTYQDNEMLEYDHSNVWRKRVLAKTEVAGTWTQAVFQVDDSPRYESLGRWQHNRSFSTWISDKTRRPLPRREFSVRQDYHVLEGVNRHTITRQGWVQEEENWKRVINQGDPEARYLSKEEGLARYRPSANVDFSPGAAYMRKTANFWTEARSIWSAILKRHQTLALHKRVDGQPLFMPLFKLADASSGEALTPDERTQLRTTIEAYVKE